MLYWVIIVVMDPFVCVAGVETDTSWWAPPQTTSSHSGTSWLETVTRDSVSPHPSWNCSATPETCEWLGSICLYMWHVRWLVGKIQVVCVLGTRCWCVPWSPPRSYWLCQTPNTLSCLWMMTQTWMWWPPSTDGASSSTQATPKERSVSLVVEIGIWPFLKWCNGKYRCIQPSIDCSVFYLSFTISISGNIIHNISLHSHSILRTVHVFCSCVPFFCFPSPLYLLLSVVADSRVEHKHSGAGGVFQSDHWHQ